MLEYATHQLKSPQAVGQLPPYEEPASVRCHTYPKKEWKGVTGELMELHGPGCYEAKLESSSPRLIVTLEQLGGRIKYSLVQPNGAAFGDRSGPISLVPGGMGVWERASVRYARRILFSFPGTSNDDRLDALRRNATPRLMFADSRVLQLSALLAAECTEAGDPCRLYGDGLATALVSALTQRVDTDREIARGGLSPRHLRHVTEYIAQNWAEPIRLRDLAAMTGLSQSHFGRMFKVSTGMPPHKWHLRIRIQRAQEMLIERRNSATDVALAAGFADQSHFTRIFRQMTGTSPGTWQRQRAT